MFNNGSQFQIGPKQAALNYSKVCKIQFSLNAAKNK